MTETISNLSLPQQAHQNARSRIESSHSRDIEELSPRTDSVEDLLEF